MPNVLVEEKDRTTIVTLNRPERRNALTIELMSELADALDKTSADPQKRVLILRGAGKAFCAGLDLQETTVVEKAHRSAEMVAKTLLAISQTRLITIAQIHGAAVAGGAGLMSACDFVVAAKRTMIGYPETKRGLVAGLVMTFLRRQLRERDIRELNPVLQVVLPVDGVDPRIAPKLDRDDFTAVYLESLCILQGASDNQPDPVRCAEVVE